MANSDPVVDPPIVEWAPEYYEERDKRAGTIQVRPRIPTATAGATMGPTPAPIVDYYRRPVVVAQVPATQQAPGITLSTTHLLIGAAILFFLLKK